MATHETMRTAAENRELVERASFETYTEGNVAVVDDLVSDDYVLHDPTAPEAIRGPEGLKDHIESLRTALPDLSATIEDVVAEDDLVAVRFTVRGTYEERMPGLDAEPTGDPFEIEGMEFDRIENGTLAETWLAFDTFEFMKQLGASPDAADSAEQ